MDREVYPELTPREALAPYLEDKADIAGNAALPNKTIAAIECRHSTANHISHLPEQDRPKPGRTKP